MKGKDLIKLIQNKNLEEFDIDVTFTDGFDNFPNIRRFELIELEDIGYSSESAILSIEEI